MLMIVTKYVRSGRRCMCARRNHIFKLNITINTAGLEQRSIRLVIFITTN